ncbi:MAG: hypothetical protein ACU0CO_06015 [Shimia sp.]
MRALPFFLALLTAVTSVGLGAARGQAQPVEAITICAGHVAQVVYVDASGEVTETQVLCPETALAMLADTAAPPAIARGATYAMLGAPDVGQATPPTSPLHRARARAPPPAV